jgi:hypothetical protein
MHTRSVLEASGLILFRKPTVLAEMGFFSPARKMHGEGITIGSSFPVQNSRLLSQGRLMFALYPMQFGSTAFRRLILCERKEVTAGASIMRS